MPRERSVVGARISIRYATYRAIRTHMHMVRQSDSIIMGRGATCFRSVFSKMNSVSSSWSSMPSGSTSAPLSAAAPSFVQVFQPTITIATSNSPLFPRWFQIGQIRQGTNVVARHRRVGALALAHNREVGQV